MFPELFNISPKTFCIALGIFIIVYAIFASGRSISQGGNAAAAYKDPFVAGILLGVLLIVGAHYGNAICVLIFLVIELIFLVIVSVSWVRIALNGSFDIIAAVVIVIQWLCLFDVYHFFKSLG